jgi:fatty acid-binding protein DegV
MEYLVGRGHEMRPKIDGAILQGSVSDREAWDFLLESKEEKESCAAVLAEAQRLIKEGKEKEIVYRENNIVQKELGAAISAYRTNSLLAKGGDDDYFSTDLADETLRNTFGRIPSSVPIMFLLGSEDPFVHKSTDKVQLLKRWAEIVKEGGAVVDEVNGGVVEGGHHNLDGDPEEVVGDLVKRVVGFVEGLSKGGEDVESRL